MSPDQRTDDHRQIQGGRKKEKHSQSHKKNKEELPLKYLQGRNRIGSSQLGDPKWQYIHKDTSPANSSMLPFIDYNFIQSRARKRRGTAARFVSTEMTQLIWLARGEQKWKSKA